MGCGSSTASAAAVPNPLAKDPEDYYVEQIHFNKLGMPKFDHFLIDVEAPVNTAVDLINDVNGIIDGLKDAVAMVVGAYKVDIQIGVDHDTVLLAIVKAADGAYPTPEEVKAIADKAKSADAKLAQAKAALYKMLESSPISLAVQGDALAPAKPADNKPEIATFNAALQELRAALAPGLKVTVATKPAGIAGGAGVSIALAKPVFKDPKSPSYDLVPLTLLDIALTKNAKAINAAESSLAVATANFSKALKGLPAEGYQLGSRGKRLVVTYPPVPKETAPAPEKKEGEGEGEKKEGEGEKKEGGQPVAEGAEEEEEEERRRQQQEAEGQQGGEAEQQQQEGGEGGEGEQQQQEQQEEEQAQGGEEAPAAQEEEQQQQQEEGQGEQEGEPEAAKEEQEQHNSRHSRGSAAVKAKEATEAAKDAADAHKADQDKKQEGEKKPAEEQKKKEEEAAGKQEKEDSGPPPAALTTAPPPGQLSGEQKTSLSKAVSSLNSQIFKLSKACNAANGPVSVGKAFFVLIDVLKDHLVSMGKDVSNLASIVELNPKISFDDGHLDFDFDFKINLPEFAHARSLEDVVALLPGKARVIYNAIMAMKHGILDIKPKFMPIKDQVMELVESSEELFKDPTAEVKAIFGEKIDAIKLMKLVTAAGGNLVKVKECVKVVSMFVSTVKRVADELTQAFEDAKKKLAAPAA